MSDQPVLDEPTIDYLLSVPKPIADANWRNTLVPPVAGRLDHRGRFDLADLPATGPVRGSLHLYSRQNLNPAVAGDWSVGMVFTDYADRSYRVIRCNGPHPSDHRNTIEGDLIVATAHVHRLTERYQRLARPRPDGYAEPTTAYHSIETAVEHLASLVNLQAVGTLFL